MKWAHAKATLDVISNVMVIGAATVILWSVLSKTLQPATAGAVEPVDLSLPASAVTNRLGTGRIAIVEFSDFECPYCGRYSRTIFPAVRKDIVKTGEVQYMVVNSPLDRIHPLAVGAAEAAECAAREGRFWEMHERLFSEPKSLTPEDLIAHGKAVGVNELRFKACLDTHATLEKVKNDQSEAARLGVQGTPSFFVGVVERDGKIDLKRRLRGLIQADVLANAVRDVLREERGSRALFERVKSIFG
jgi:protein-disulfide isomerase